MSTPKAAACFGAVVHHVDVVAIVLSLYQQLSNVSNFSEEVQYIITSAQHWGVYIDHIEFQNASSTTTTTT